MTPAPERPDHVHQQRFDGDDPYLICDCGARWDAISGSQLYALPRSVQDDMKVAALREADFPKAPPLDWESDGAIAAPVTDAGLREALERIADPELVDAPGGFYCPWCGTNVNQHGTTCPVAIARAALSRQAEKETP